jgi:hypothetical protein
MGILPTNNNRTSVFAGSSFFRSPSLLAGFRLRTLINKVDLRGGMEKGRGLARNLLESISPGIERVVLGQARETPLVKEIITRSTSL